MMRLPAALLIGLVVIIVTAPLAAAAPAPEQRPAGRPLEDVLRDLQRRGLRIVFSTEVVRPSMRVEREPGSGDARSMLDEVLRPHGLVVQPAARGVLLVVRGRPAPAPSPAAASGTTSIHGLVVDANSAAPLAGAIVRIRQAGAEAVSDSDGRFVLAALEPGTHRLFVTLVGYSLAEPDVTVTRGPPLAVTIALSAGAGTYTEEVAVVGDRFRGAAATVPSAMVLNNEDLRELRGVLTEDPFRAIQSLPGVMTGNDLRSEFSVRGSDFRHVGLTVDGMTTTWPVHSVRSDWSGGSIGLINADVIESITLMAGAYPQELPARNGGWIDLTIREGSRVRTQAHVAASMTSVSLVTEGPVGATARGSWLLSARQSYLQWVLKRWGATGTIFGFGDVQGKFVFDVTPRHRFLLTGIAGRSLLKLERTHPDANLVTRGSSYSGLFTAAWHSTFGDSTTLVQKLGWAGDGFDNDGAVAGALAEGTGRELSYRADATFAAGAASTLRFGVLAQRQSTDQLFTRFIGFVDANRDRRDEPITGSRTILSAFGRASRRFGSRLTIDGGALVTRADVTTTSPWGLAEASLGPWTLRAGAGIYRQLPGLDQTASVFGGPHLRPERSRHVDVAIERTLLGHTRLQATVFRRDERDVMRLVGDEFRADGDRLVLPSMTPAWRNTLRARTRGVEILAQRRSASGVSGWVAYTYATSRYADTLTGETFDGDHDQRHSFNAYAQLRVSPVTVVSGKLRMGSRVPIPGYLSEDGGITRIGEIKNGVRLPTYARLDLRANRAFNWGSSRLTLFVEVMNVLARTNKGPACPCTGWADAPLVFSNGQVTTTTQRMAPFLPTVGLVIDF